MPDQEMIDRVAKAIDEASQPPGRPDYKMLMENCAKAAIQAMREPTKRMTTIEYGCYAGETAWRAMIDGILK